MRNKNKTTTAKEESPPALVPRLRFPEFRNAGTWKIKKVDDLVDSITPPKKLPTISYASIGAFPIIDQSQAEICGWTDDKDALIHEDLPLIIFGDHTCILKIMSIPFAQGADGIKILRTRNEIETRYLYQFLSSQPVIMEQYKRHYSILKAKLVFYPEFCTGEQQKIAACLSSLDELIAAQARKVDALKSHKKGLMQQLFPREGETQPRWRFPEFRGKGEWEEVTFREIFEFKSTNTFSRHQLNYDSGTVRNIHYGDIHTKYSTSFYIEDEVVPYVNHSESLSKIKSDAYCQEGDLVFADASEDLIDVGKSIELVSLCGEKVLAGSHTILTRPNKGIFVIGFAGYLFRGRAVRSQIQHEAQGTKVMQVSPTRLADIKVSFTKNMPEQHRIASCLSSLDALIVAETQKLEALKTHKKGLMQGLLPCPEDVE